MTIKRIISIIGRDKNGKLSVVADKKKIICDDTFAGRDKEIAALQKKGYTSVLTLLEDDSVSKNWTEPVE